MAKKLKLKRCLPALQVIAAGILTISATDSTAAGNRKTQEAVRPATPVGVPNIDPGQQIKRLRAIIPSNKGTLRAGANRPTPPGRQNVVFPQPAPIISDPAPVIPEQPVVDLPGDPIPPAPEPELDSTPTGPGPVVVGPEPEPEVPEPGTIVEEPEPTEPAQPEFEEHPVSRGGVDFVVPGRILLQAVKDADAKEVDDLLRPFSGKVNDEIRGLGIKVVEVPPQALEHALHGLKRNPRIQFAEPDAILAPDATSNDPYLSSEWHISKIQAPAAWDTTFGSSSVIIAILDTGVDSSHPDLAPNILPGWNFYDNNSNSSDVHGHGTAVAGAAAAAVNNAIGVAGVAGSCKILPIRVSDSQGYASFSTIAKALSWAADQGARAANISFRASTSSAISSAAQYFQSKGGVVTISSGNEGAVETAPDNPYVLTVGATDSTDTIASWSNRGNIVDVSAPGVSIRTTTRGGGYGSWSGTSFSAPVVAGVAALVVSANPSLSGADALQIVKSATDDLGATGYDTVYGTGRVNASKAVALALGAAPTPEPTPEPEPVPEITPIPTTDTIAPNIAIKSPVNGAVIGNTANLSVTVSASDNVAVVKVELYVDGKLINTSSSAPFTTKWPAKKVAAGAHVILTKAYDAVGNCGSSQSITVYK